MEMAHALKPHGVRSITGSELTLDDSSHVTLLCETRRGYSNLCRLITRAHAGTRRWAREGVRWEGPGSPVRPGQDPLDEEPRVSLADLEEHADGLVSLSGCARDGAVARLVEADRHAEAALAARRLLAAFGRERFRIELQRPFWRHDRRRNRLLAELAERLGVPCVATGNVHAHDVARAALQDTMGAVRLRAHLCQDQPARRGHSPPPPGPPGRGGGGAPPHPPPAGG